MAKKSRSRSDPTAATTPAWAIDAIIRHNRIEKLVESLPDPWRDAVRGLALWRGSGRPLPNDPDLYVARACLQWLLDLRVNRTTAAAAARRALKEVDAFLQRPRPRGRPRMIATEAEGTAARAEYQACLRAARDAGRPLGDLRRKEEKLRIAKARGQGTSTAKIAALFRKPAPSRPSQLSRGGLVTIEEILRLTP